MVEKDNRLSFRSRVSQAPEFKKPFQLESMGRNLIDLPFLEIPLDEKLSEEKIIFEAKSSFSESMDVNPILIRVSYEDPYGLEAKRTIVQREFDGSELLMQKGEVKRNFGEIDIVLSSNLKIPLDDKETLSDMENFIPTISVMSSGKEVPPIARIEYDSSSQLPITVKFPYADFWGALKGEVEKRDDSNNHSYRYTYFNWEHLVGAKVGTTKYKFPAHPDSLEYYNQFVKINNMELTALPEDNLYEEKISKSSDNWKWGSGRLRFSRINKQTGEVWMFSVPEWIDKKNFNANIQDDSLMDFFWRYPVVFCVKRKGEDGKWYATWSKKDTQR
jgi:hypothetical protein